MEEDIDLHLQGISSLMGDSKPISNNIQQGLVNKDSGKMIPQPVGEMEGNKDSSCMEANDCTRNLLVIRGENIGDWRDVQPF